MSADKIDAAIAAASAPQQVRMIPINVTLGVSGRVIQMAVPADIQLIEAANLCSWILSTEPGQGLQGHLEKINAAPPALEIARTLPPGLPRMQS